MSTKHDSAGRSGKHGTRQNVSTLQGRTHSGRSRPSVGLHTGQKGGVEKKFSRGEIRRLIEKGRTRTEKEDLERLGLKRWYRFEQTLEVWLESGFPSPTHHLVIHLGTDNPPRIDSVASELGEHLSEIRRRVTRAGAPWLAAWVIELKSGLHAHVLLYLPNDPKFLRRLAKWLMVRFGMPQEQGRSPLFVLRRVETGQPVHLSAISALRTYSVTGRAGAEGVADYISKSIARDCKRTSRGRILGRQVGCSTALSRLRRSWSTR